MATLKEALEYAKMNPNSSFATALRTKIENGEADEQAKAEGIQLPGRQPEPNIAQTIAGGLLKAPSRLGQTTGAATIAAYNTLKGDGTLADNYEEASKLYEKSGQLLGGNLFGENVQPAQNMEQIAGDIMQTGANLIPGATLGKGGTTLAKIGTGVGAGAGTGGLIGAGQAMSEDGSLQDVVTQGLIGAGIGGAIGGAIPGVPAAVNLAKIGAGKIANAPIVSGTGEVIKSVGRTIKSIPENVATNVGEMQAKETVIKSIPSVVGQNAARKGVEVVDINTLKEVASTPQAKTLIKAVKDFSSGTSKVDPIEIVGKPIVAKIKALDKKANEVGAKLGEVAKKLDVVTKPELESSVMLRLKQVPGLKDLEVDEKGVLDFGRTTLTSDFTKADREAIQMAYDGATRWGNGEKAHKFRQELFEVLDGKKKSLTNLTDTQDKALNAIRAGLSDVLETKNPEYKKLSNDYRKIVQPLSEMRKLSKTLDPNNPEDVLNLSAGLLARRLTSAAASNPQIRMVLGELDKATKVKGKTLDDTQKLQDLYNVLNKYYDIAPKTGFQNLVKEGVNTPTGIIDQATGAIKEFAGTTNAVRQKALEDYLSELLSKTSKAKKQPK